MVTSGSFKRESSRWTFDVKGEPVEPVRRTLDIERPPARGKGMNDPEVSMPNVFNNANLIAHEKALEAPGDAITFVLKVPAPLK